MEAVWLTHAKRLQAIASTGLYFSSDPYDRERFSEIADIANAMLSSLGDVPVQRILGLVSDFAQGYATPKVDVRGAVVRRDEVLLVRERSDGRWTLPGGFAEVGKSPAENVEKEILEEAGLRVRARQLYGVRHKAKASYQPDARDFYKLFFLCHPVDNGSLSAGSETTEAAYFQRQRLPELSAGRVIREDIEAAFEAASGARDAAFFD